MLVIHRNKIFTRAGWQFKLRITGYSIQSWYGICGSKKFAIQSILAAMDINQTRIAERIAASKLTNIEL